MATKNLTEMLKQLTLEERKAVMSELKASLKTPTKKELALQALTQEEIKQLDGYFKKMNDSLEKRGLPFITGFYCQDKVRGK
jgi:hypothetical protein